MEKLRTAIENEGDTSIVKLAGFIDEHNRLKQLVEQITATTAMIDLSGVERINSSGVRDWVNWIAALEANGTTPVLVRCSPAIVAQINLVKNFTGNGAVKSFLVPYRCSECDEEKSIVVETSEMTSPGASPPTCNCIVCGHPMQVDEMPEAYFAFLAGPAAQREGLGRGSSSSLSGSNPVIKSRVKTRDRRSSPPARQSQPVLSAFQTNTPAAGVRRQSSNDLLGKRSSRPSQPKLAIGSNDRISAPQVAPSLRPSQSAVESKSHVLMLTAIILILLLGIAALGYVVLMT
ncbi:MAG: anti-sigma factor antagonist [Deltaproteobacteria bacterium]|nr:anti-sigma factor antagonist [Deltaproteobacteria bacterium]